MPVVKQLSHALLLLCLLVAVGCAPTNQRAEWSSSKEQISASNAPRVKLLHAFAGLGAAGDVAFAPDGKSLAAVSSDQVLNVWPLDEGRLADTLSWNTSSEVDGLVSGVAFSPDTESRRLIAVGGADNYTRVWSLDNQQLVQQFYEPTGASVTAVAFSPDGQCLATAANGIHLWRLDDGTLLHTLQQNGDHTIDSLAFSPNGKFIAGLTGDFNKEVGLWSVRDGSLARKLGKHQDPATGLAFSPDGETLATSSLDKQIYLWKVEDGSQLNVLVGHSAYAFDVAFSPNGEVIASAGQTLELWEAATGKDLQTLTGHTDTVWSVQFSPDGTLLASASEDGTVRLWGVGKED